jgi:hypothetical protein
MPGVPAFSVFLTGHRKAYIAVYKSILKYQFFPFVTIEHRAHRAEKPTTDHGKSDETRPCTANKQSVVFNLTIKLSAMTLASQVVL